MQSERVRPEDVNGKPLALLLIAGDDDMAVAVGQATWDGTTLTWRGKDSQLDIPADALDRLRQVGDDPERVFEDADFYVSLSVGPLPKGAKDSGLFQRIGLTWPKLDQ